MKESASPRRVPEHALRRPHRVSLPDFSGRPCSLADGPEAWSAEGAGEAALLLGLGPGRPWELPFLADMRAVYWLDSPATRAALAAQPAGEHADAGGAAAQTGKPPRHWREVSPDEAVRLASSCRRFFYRAGLRLDPAFWGPLLGRLDAAACGAGRGAGRAAPAHGMARRAVLLPGTDAQLLHQELRAALACCGFGPILERVPSPLGEGVPGGSAAGEADFVRNWRRLLAQGRPAWLLSVNLRGLDAEGRVFHLCRELGVPVAVWFVDNPWHVLAGLRLPWWREAHLFVTDAGFVPSLRAEGARHAHALPLAVAPHMWRADADLREPDGPPLFVGRSAFPDRDRFFAAARVPPALEAAAAERLRGSSGPEDAPHFFWWRERLGGALWPGHDVRRMGLGAERCARANRVRWLLAAGAGQPGGVRVAGDDGWGPLLPGAELLPPVDYYTALPDLYAGAGAVLNVTSLLLPRSLSQRHFDVWACGGLLLSDATQGLDIFPRELTEPMTLRGPEDFLPRLERLRARPREVLDLRRAWREHLRAEHGYAQRVRAMRERLGGA